MRVKVKVEDEGEDDDLLPNDPKEISDEDQSGTDGDDS